MPVLIQTSRDGVLQSIGAAPVRRLDATTLGRLAQVAATNTTAIGARSSAGGVYATALGYGANAGGTYAMALGYGANAGGTYATALGYSANAGGNYATALGYGAIAGGGATALGYNANAGGNYAMALGYSANAGGNYATALGYNASAARYGQHATANGRFAINGDAQLSQYVLRRQTGDATPTEFASDGSTTGYVTIPTGTILAGTMHVVARRTDTTGDNAAWPLIKLAIARDATGNCYLLGTVDGAGTTTYCTAGASTWTVSVTADTTNNRLAITATGEAAKTIRWVATLDLTEVA
jgi:Head domain of trimeric autotransporter adhesin